MRPTSNVGPYTKSADIERRPAEVSVTPRPLKNEVGESTGPMSIGVMLAPNYQRTDVVKADNVIDAAAKAGAAVQDITSDTARSIFQLLGGLLMGKGPPAGQSVPGPVGVLKDRKRRGIDERPPSRGRLRRGDIDRPGGN
uniref:Uncharacterized protein n=1 Tax=Pseudictyota dubia TaxID=2749911 RepID=A0A7R9Z2C8_9STRA